MAILALKNHLAYKTIFDIHVQEKKIQTHETHTTNNLTWTLITRCIRQQYPFPHYIALYDDYIALNDKCLKNDQTLGKTE